ncbi:MAG: hypothetical protein E7304_07920 [Butyrivibrio sp.]|uniref:DUF4315 family protein n=1 Tax=Butyrivibrio sp. TaxID=28121 RepID=UPI001EB7863C|nr:DUF4315 family protein [Butyrivibrio sp.]MBE5841315.1 hypothetical protein [Butyrivibrio sp.]
MFEKLQRIRAEVERNGKRLEEDQKKYDDSLARLKAEEATTVLGVVEIMKLTPEKAAELLGYREEPKTSASKSKKKDTSEKKSVSEEAIDDQNATNVGMEDILNESY